MQILPPLRRTLYKYFWSFGVPKYFCDFLTTNIGVRLPPPQRDTQDRTPRFEDCRDLAYVWDFTIEG